MYLGDITNYLKYFPTSNKCSSNLLHPIIPIYKILCYQLGYCKKFIYFNKNIQKFALSASHDPEEVKSTIFVSRANVSGIVEFRVRSERDLSAFRKLKDKYQ